MTFSLRNKDFFFFPILLLQLTILKEHMLFQVSEEHVPSIQHHSLGIKQNMCKNKMSPRDILLSLHISSVQRQSSLENKISSAITCGLRFFKIRKYNKKQSFLSCGAPCANNLVLIFILLLLPESRIESFKWYILI